jgi:dephospho-CoA kinase
VKQERIIGLTGGIGTGKSTVTKYLQHRYSLPILDADIYSREAVGLGSSILAEIFVRYGCGLKLADGNLDRRALGEIIFHDLGEKKWLEDKIHPYVIERMLTELGRLDRRIVVLAIPLLFEANLTYLVTEIWVVFCSIERQLERLQSRDNLTEEEAKRRIANQWSIEGKIAAADCILDNNYTLDNLYRQVDFSLQTKGSMAR